MGYVVLCVLRYLLLACSATMQVQLISWEEAWEEAQRKTMEFINTTFAITSPRKPENRKLGTNWEVLMNMLISGLLIGLMMEKGGGTLFL